MLSRKKKERIQEEWNLKKSQSPRIKMIKCGRKGCLKCPHGPYLYIRERKNDKYIDKYIGKCKLDGSHRE